jgi:threonine dehydratase
MPETPLPETPLPETPQVTLDDVRAARELLAGVSRVTPLEGSRPLGARVGGPVHLKCENLQRAGSFKIRGAYVRIARLSDDERSRGVVAASAGNHAQGVALAARLLGVHTTVFMPDGAPIPKVEATRAYGATVRFTGHTVDQALVAAKAFSEETGTALIHPFDHVDIVAGQGTVGLEVLEQCPDVRTVVVCTGGGGLLAGIAVAVKALRPDVRVVGVQAAGAAAYPGSLVAGGPLALDTMSTMADGIAVGCPGRCRTASSPHSSTTSSRCPRSRCPVPCCSASSARSSSSSRPAPPVSPPCSTTRRPTSRRSWRCCPGATSIPS